MMNDDEGISGDNERNEDDGGKRTWSVINDEEDKADGENNGSEETKDQCGMA